MCVLAASPVFVAADYTSGLIAAAAEVLDQVPFPDAAPSPP